MSIEKTKFMVLVAAISASAAGCATVDDDGNGSEGGGAPTTTSSSSQGGGGTGGDASGGGTGGDTTGSGGEGGAGGGEACLGDTGTPDACSSECGGLVDNCNSLAWIKDGVAVEVVECLNALDPNTCSAGVDGYGGCFLPNLLKACPDPTAVAPCSELAEACNVTDDAAWQAECSSYLSGMTETARSLMSPCVRDNCAIDADTFEFCANSLYYVD